MASGARTSAAAKARPTTPAAASSAAVACGKAVDCPPALAVIAAHQRVGIGAVRARLSRPPGPSHDVVTSPSHSIRRKRLRASRSLACSTMLLALRVARPSTTKIWLAVASAISRASG